MSRPRITTNDYKQKVNEKFGNDYKVLGKYQRSNLKIKIRHKCGYTWDVRASSFLNSQGCPKCNRRAKGINSRRFNKNNFKEFFKKTYGPSFILKSEYNGTFKSHIRIEHTLCKTIFTTTVRSFVPQGTRCPVCRGYTGHRPFSKYKGNTATERFKSWLKLNKPEYTLAQGAIYVNNKNKMLIKHICGYEWNTSFNSLKRGGCPKCAFNRIGLMSKDTTFIFKQKLKNKKGNSYLVVGSYKNTITPIRIKHFCCDGGVCEFEISPSKILGGQSCPRCSKLKVKKLFSLGKDKAQNKLDALYSKGTFTIISDYINISTPLKIRHLTCNNILYTPLRNLLKGHGCPYCSDKKSYGEKLIESLLIKNKISYIPQKTFSDLKDANKLSYDFYIANKKLLIEYDGIQHYKPIDYFGGINEYKIQKKHDKMKTVYAKKHRIKLLRIPYYIKDEKSIAAILIKENII